MADRREPEEAAPREPKAASLRVLEAAALPEPESASLQEPEIISLKEPDTALPQASETAPQQAPETAPQQAPETAPQQAPETASLQKPEAAPLQEQETASLQEPVIAPLQEPETAPLQQAEIAPRQEKGITSQQKQTNSMQESETAPLHKPGTAPLYEPETASLHEPDTVTLQESDIGGLQEREAASPQEPGTDTLQESETAAPRGLETAFLQEQDTAPLHEPETAPRPAPATASLQEPETAPLQAPETAPLQAPETAPLQAPDTAYLQEPETAPLQEPDNAPPQEPETAPLHEPETAPLHEPETAPLQKPEKASLQEPEIASQQEPEHTHLQEPETVALQESDTTSLREPDTAPLQAPETALLPEPNTASLQEPETASLKEQDTAPLQEQTNSMQESETAPLHEPGTAALHEPETASLHEPETVTLQDPETAAPRGLEAAVLHEQDTAPLHEPETALLQEPETVTLQEQETTYLKELETTPLDEPETAPLQEPDTAPLQEPETAPLQEPETAPRQEQETAQRQEQETAQRQEQETAQRQEQETAQRQEPETAPLQEPETAPLQEPETAPLQEPETAPLQEPETAPLQEPETTDLQKPETAPRQEQETAPLQEPETAPLQQPETAPLQQPETAPLQQPETAPLQQPETAPLQQPETAPLQQPETAPLQQPETAPLQQPETAPLQQPETAPLQQPETAPPQEPETAPPQEPETAPPQEPETAPRQEPETALRREPETNSQQEQTTSLQESETASLHEPETASLHEPETAARQEPETAALQEPGSAYLQEPETITPQGSEIGALQAQEAASLQEPETATLQKIETAALQELEAATLQETETVSLRRLDAASLQEPGTASLQEPKSTTLQELQPEPGATSVQENSVSMHQENGVRIHREDGAPEHHENGAPSHQDNYASASQQNGAYEQQESASVAQECVPSGNNTSPENAADDTAKEIIESMMAVMNRMQNVRAQHPVANHWDLVAENLSNKLARDELMTSSDVRGSGTFQQRDSSTKASTASKQTSTNGGARPKESAVNDGARSKYSPANRVVRTKETEAVGGARPKQTQANNEGVRLKKTSTNGCARTGMSKDVTGGHDKTSKRTGAPTPKQRVKFQWRGHHNDLLEREQDESVMHMVLPSPCFNNHTVHFGFLNRGNPTKRVDSDRFVESDGGFPIFRCEEESDCSSRCPVYCDGEGFPVVAMSFDSFCKTYHVEADQCKECGGGVELARASITGRARLIYEQMNGAHPQQTAFRIWEHERGVKVNTSRGQPPPTNTLISVEKVHDRELKSQEYEHLFSVLMGLRGIQSLFAFASASWNSTIFANAKRSYKQRKRDIDSHAGNVTSILEKSGVLLRGDDNQLRGTVPARCRPGKDVASVEAEPWFPRVDRICVKMQWVQSNSDKRVQKYALEAAEVVGVKEILWGTMISVNQPMAEKYYLDMPFTPEEIPAEEQLVGEERLLKSSAFSQIFLAQLKIASGQGKLAWLGPHHSWNGVLYTWKLRRRPEDCVRDLSRPLMPERLHEEFVEAGPSFASTCRRGTNGETAPDRGNEDVDAPGNGGGASSSLGGEGKDARDIRSEVSYAFGPGNEQREAPSPGDKSTLGPGYKNAGASGSSNKRVNASDPVEINRPSVVSNDGLRASQSELLGVDSARTHESKTGNGDVRNLTVSSSVSQRFSVEVAEWQESSPGAPQHTRKLTTDSSEVHTADKKRARITRVESKDSGYPHSSGSGSGTTSRDDSTTRSDSLESGSAPPDSISPSSNSGQTSPVGDHLYSGSERSSPTDQEPSKDSDLTSRLKLDSASSQILAPGSDLFKPIPTRSDIANETSEQTHTRPEESIIFESPSKEWTGKAALSPQRQGEDIFCPDDGNSSDASTIKDSASTLTKGSRRRSSGEISGGSDFDDSGSFASKSYSPSKSAGRDRLSREEGITGEALQAFTIPEERDMSEENPSDAINVSVGAPRQYPAKAPPKQHRKPDNPSSEVSNPETHSNELRTKPIPVQPKENDDKSRSYVEMPRIPKNIKMYAHLKNPGINITEAENEEFMTTVTDSLWEITRESTYPAFMRIDDRRSVNSESLRSLSAKDFAKQAYDGYAYKCLLNVSSRPETRSRSREAGLPTPSIETSSKGVEHPHEGERGTRHQQAAEPTEGNIVHRRSERSKGAEGSGSSSSPRGVAQEVGEGRRMLPKTGLNNRAFKRSPLRFLSSLKSSHAHEENKSTTPLLADIREHPFGLSSISRRQIEKSRMQAHFVCQRIMQRGAPLNCCCGAKIGDEQLKRLATKLEDMLTKGRMTQFLNGQRKLLGHVCKGSIMDYVQKASYPTETDIALLNDLMLIMELHHNPKASPHSYCRDKTEKLAHGQNTSDGPDCGRFATLTCKEAGLLLARHHLWTMRQTDFFDPNQDDPLTCMTLHEHGLKEPEKAMKLTPFQLFLEWHLNTDLLRGLCDQLNGYAKRHDTDRSFRGWTELLPDELRVFLLQMVYVSSNHPRDKRWDGPPRSRRLGKKLEKEAEHPDDPTQAADGSNPNSESQKEDEVNGGDTEPGASEDQEGSGSKERSHRANMDRLRTSMGTHRFRQIAAAWRVFDFCEPPRRSERRRRLQRLQTVLDALNDGRAVAALPALLAVGARGVRCRNPPVARRTAGYRHVDVTLVMDSKRYVHDVVIAEATRRSRFRTIHPNVVNRIRNKLKPSTEKNIVFYTQQINNIAARLARANQPGAEDVIVKESEEEIPRLPDSMIRYFYMDGLNVSEAKRCADSGILCMAPISPDDPRCSEFAAADEDMPNVVSDNGRLICVPYGNQEKLNFFHSHVSTRRRYQLVCSAFHQLDGISGIRAQQQVKKTQQAVRETVKQITGRLSHGSTKSGLRYYHRLFLRALSACVQNSIIAHAIARKRRVSQIAVSTAASTSSTIEAHVPFDSTAETLAAHCDTEFEKFLSELMDWLEKTPRVNPKSKPTLSSGHMHDQLTTELLRTSAETGDGVRSEILIHNTNKMAVMLENMVEKTRQVGDKQQQHGAVVVTALEDSGLF